MLGIEANRSRQEGAQTLSVQIQGMRPVRCFIRLEIRVPTARKQHTRLVHGVPWDEVDVAAQVVPPQQRRQLLYRGGS